MDTNKKVKDTEIHSLLNSNIKGFNANHNKYKKSNHFSHLHHANFPMLKKHSLIEFSSRNSLIENVRGFVRVGGQNSLLFYFSLLVRRCVKYMYEKNRRK